MTHAPCILPLHNRMKPQSLLDQCIRALTCPCAHPNEEAGLERMVRAKWQGAQREDFGLNDTDPSRRHVTTGARLLQVVSGRDVFRSEVCC